MYGLFVSVVGFVMLSLFQGIGTAAATTALIAGFMMIDEIVKKSKR